MPKYKPLEYPDNLTKKYWDKNKGVLAKTAGKTGVGEAAQAAHSAFNAINWDNFDIAILTPNGNSDEALRGIKQLKPIVLAEWNRSVKPTIAALNELRKTADAASSSLAKNKLLKDAVALAAKIAKDADHLGVSLQLNSVFFDAVNKECETSLTMVEESRALMQQVATETKKYLAMLLSGLAKVQAAPVPTPTLWDKVAKQPGRSVSNNLKSNPVLAKKHLKTWTVQFQGFDWATLGFGNIEDPAKLKDTIHQFIAAVKKEAAVLAKDLG